MTFLTDAKALDHEQIASLSYRLYESRGRQDGHDLEDWFAAEGQLIEERKADMTVLSAPASLEVDPA
jgi:hypothetical protein